jgi:GTP-binding protein EngB required for normal cell division
LIWCHVFDIAEHYDSFRNKGLTEIEHLYYLASNEITILEKEMSKVQRKRFEIGLSVKQCDIPEIKPNDSLLQWCLANESGHLYVPLRRGGLRADYELSGLTRELKQELCAGLKLLFGSKIRFIKKLEELDAKLNEAKLHDAKLNDAKLAKLAKLNELNEAKLNEAEPGSDGKLNVGSVFEVKSSPLQDLAVFFDDCIISIICKKFPNLSEPKKMMNFGDELKKSELYKWCVKNKVDAIYGRLYEENITSPMQLQQLPQRDLIELSQDLGFNFGKQMSFINIVQKVQPQIVHQPQHQPQQPQHQQPQHQQPQHQQRQQQQPQHQVIGEEEEKYPGILKRVYNGVKDYFSSSDPKKKNVYFETHGDPASTKTILVIGETGSGKTSAINSMVNFLWKCKNNDTFRYQLITEELSNGQSQSVTDAVQSYYINPPNMGSLCIIDTPGFGDTRGMKQDDSIVKQIKTFFETSLSGIDGVCFVVKGTATRLSSQQFYVFSRVLGLFGKDIVNNIFVLFTFCGASQPKCALKALSAAKIHYSEYFTINNEPFRQVSSGNIHLWRTSMKQLECFFDIIQQTKTVSLDLTKRVLDRREQLENVMVTLSPVIDAKLNSLQNIKLIEKEVNNHKDQIEFSRDFSVEIEEPQIVRIDLPKGRNTTTCTKCNFTCHQNCVFSNNNDKKNCCAMSSSGKCTVCPKNCHWTHHANLPWLYQYSSQKKIITQEALEEQFVNASSKKSKCEQIIIGLKAKHEEAKSSIRFKMEVVLRCLNELEQDALRPNILNQSEYINNLIISEETEQKHGWVDRVRALETLKTMNKSIETLKTMNKCAKNYF